MVSVFSRVLPDWRFRNIFPMVLAALGKPYGVSGALSRPKPPGTLWGDSGLSGSTENLRMALPGCDERSRPSGGSAAQFDPTRAFRPERLNGRDWPEGAYLLLSEVLSEADIDIGVAVDPLSALSGPSRRADLLAV